MCDALKTASLAEQLAALRDHRSYDENEGDPYGGPRLVSVSDVAVDLLASRGAEAVPALLDLAAELPAAARALTLSQADLGPFAERLLDLYLHGPELVSQELCHRLARMDLSARVPLTSRGLRLLRLEDGPGLERALEQVPSLLLEPALAEEALNALYLRPVEPWLSASRPGLVGLLRGPFAERAAEVLGSLRDGSVELADLAVRTGSDRLAGVALQALAKAPAERLEPLLDRLLAVKGEHRIGRLMKVLQKAARPRTRGFIEEFLDSVAADSWPAEAAREALAALEIE